MLKAFEKKNTGFIAKVEMTSVKGKLVYWIFFTILLILGLICFLPVVWIVVSGLKDTEEFYMIPPTLIPRSFHPWKIVELWNRFKFMKFYINSFIYAGGHVIATLFVNGLAAFALSRLKPSGYKSALTFFAVMMLLPGSVGMVPLYMQLVDLPYLHVSTLNSYIPLCLMGAANAYYIILLKNFFDSVSHSYIEAAKIDGCSIMGIFFKIMIPLCVPAFVVIAIFTFMASWGNFLWPSLIINDYAKYSVAEFLFRTDMTNYSLDEYMIILTLSIIPPVIIFIIFQKKIMTGFTLGGVKE